MSEDNNLDRIILLDKIMKNRIEAEYVLDKIDFLQSENERLLLLVERYKGEVEELGERLDQYE